MVKYTLVHDSFVVLGFYHRLSVWSNVTTSYVSSGCSVYSVLTILSPKSDASVGGVIARLKLHFVQLYFITLGALCIESFRKEGQCSRQSLLVSPKSDASVVDRSRSG